MNLTTLKTNLIRRVKERPIWFLAGGGIVLALLIVSFLRPGHTEAASTYYTVKRGDFLISIVEGGTLQAVNEVSIRNDVEGSSRVIFIVPEGTYVKKGDLLVELDSAEAQNQLNQQQINFEKAQFALIQAKEQLQIQKSVVESEVRAAELKVEFAETDLKKYLEGEAVQERRKAEIDIANIMEKLAIDEDRLKWSEKLHEQGFETKSNLDRDRLTVTQSKLNLETFTNALWMWKQFDFPKKKRQYESAVEEAKADLERVKQQGAGKLAQYEADMRTQENTLELNRERLARDKRQLEAAKIHAPQDGLVVYAASENRFSSESLIEEGATVRNRQILIKLPDISEMKLSVKIHESHVNMVSPGQPAFIVLDSMPDQRFRGVVNKVGLLPDSQSRWGNPNLKVYATEILITDRLPDVKPGVSARAEIVVTNLQNVISVPIQAVTTQQGRQVIYLADSDPPEAVPVQVGLYNTKFIEITEGLKEGDRIMLAPPFDTQEKDLGGAVLAEGDKAAATNLVAVAPPGNGTATDNGNGEQPRRQPGDSTGQRMTERPQRQQQQEAGQTPQTGGARPNFDELRKQYDKNGDGQLDEEERQAMRTAMRERSGQPQQEGGARPRRQEPAGEVQRGGQGQPADGERGTGTRRTRERRPEGASETATNSGAPRSSESRRNPDEFR